MPWTESHTVLIRHRKLVELATALRIRPAHAIGHLHALWHAALEQQEDGDLSAWSDEFIAQASDYPGDAPQYVRLLQKYRWLDGRIIHDWLDYAGRYLEVKYRTRNPKRLDEIRAIHDMGKTVARPRSDLGPTQDGQPDSTNQTNQRVGGSKEPLVQGGPGKPAPAAPPPAVSAAPNAEEAPTNRPTLEQARLYFSRHQTGFREEEVRECYRQFEASAAKGFWYWGKRLVGDWRAAMEQRILDNREKRGGKKPPTDAGAALKREIERCARI